MTDQTEKLFWTDLETTGLDPAVDTVLEVAAVVTDGDLNTLVTFHAIIGKDPDLRMGRFVWQMHEANGLLAEIDAEPAGEVPFRGSRLGISVRLGEVIEQYAPGAPMAGSSVAFDRGFYKVHFPQAEKHLHYRNFDVSVYKEAMKRWAPDVELPASDGKHRAMPDILASIELAKHWRGRVLERK